MNLDIRSPIEDINQLVSIIVITYNSSNFIINTLESAKNQTYNDIELIISDDCSKDSTIEVCQKWLDKNKERFIRTKLITVQTNAGISANCNRGINASTGGWIKLIAGDDILLPHCIASNVSFAKENNSSINFSKMNFFRDNSVFRKGEISLEQKLFIKKNQAQQTKSYIRNAVFLNIPTLFYSRELSEGVGGFNEDFKLLEDTPFILKVLENGYKIHFLDETTVNYRVHSSSITGSAKNNFIREIYRCYNIYRKPYLRNYNLVDLCFKLYLKLNFYFLLNGWVSKKWYRAFGRITIVIRILS
jgi:alpha-1,3-rhamnosyltransferase